MSSFVNGCVFTPASSGTGSFVVSAAVTGWQTPAQASAANGAQYSYRAYSADNTQWEIGVGVYTSGTVTLTRTPTASSNAGSAVNFTVAPSVALTVLATDLTVPTSLSLVNATGLPLTTGVTGTLAATNGGTGTATYTTGDILYASATNTLSKLGKGTALQILRQNSALTAPEWAAAREVLTGARTYYVRTDGSNSNTGLVNSAGGAFLTVQKALDVIWGTLDLSGFNITVQVVDGTYTGSTAIDGRLVGKGIVTILGNTGTPANVIISTTSANCFTISGGAMVTVSGMELRVTTSGTALQAVDFGSKIIIGASMRFGAGVTHIMGYGGGYVSGRVAYEVTGSATYHWLAQIGGIVDVQAVTITLTGTPAFSGAFVRSSQAALVLGGFNTFTGSATGIRYQAVTNGGIDSNAGGATYFPGGTAGTATAPGWYN